MALSEGTSRTRLQPDSEERFVPLRRELEVSSFGINQMNLLPGQRSRIHLHENQEEVFIVLSGELTIAIEGEEEAVAEGEAIRVAPSLRRQLSNRGSVPLTMIALGGHGEHQGRDAIAFTDWSAAEGGSPRDIPLPEDLEA